MLHLHHSNKLQKLTQSLIRAMNIHPQALLQPVPILVQNPGMKRWLQHEISKIQGVAANLEFPLPSRFVWDIFQSQFQDIKVQSSYDSEVLRWRIMQILDKQRTEPAFVPLNSYLDSDENGLARLQLSEKLASLFDQYLVYRPEMVYQWGHSKDGFEKDESWQARLWQLLQQQDDQPHRAELIYRLGEKIHANQLQKEELPASIYVFAISTLSPLYQNLLCQLASETDVHFFILNPCQHYWGDVQTSKQKLGSPKKQTDLFEQEFGNDLLSSLGQQGREFIDSFYDSSFQLQENELFERYDEEHLLAQVKNNILELQQHTVECEAQRDESIQIVSCYSELRELQVLHDFLLSRFQQDKTLQPHDVVIMSPDINTLAPYIDAVFGQQPHNRLIPYSISDQNVLSGSPLMQTVIEWLKLPGSRFAVNQILSYLELPALQRRYQLDQQALDSIRYWIRSNFIHWGLDAEQRERLGLGNTSLNSWKFGIQRLLAAYFAADEDSLFYQHVISDCLPTQNDIRVLGNLHHLLDDLDHWSQQFQQTGSVQQWQKWIQQMMDDLLLLDDDEEWQLNPLREQMANWIEQSSSAGFEQQMNASQLHHLLSQSLALGSSDHHYLSGGINFCNLIPMRSIPFRIVCLLGLGNDHFPRSDISPRFDLIALHPKKGDRSRREDDRYMFLQSLMSAQDCFYISYVGQDRKDDTALEPSVLVTELIDHIKQSCAVALSIRKTSLQAFSEKNFQQGSYAEQWMIKTGQVRQPFNQPIESVPRTPLDQMPVDLNEVIKFYNNPAKYFMQSRLNISLQEYDEILQDDERFFQHGLDQYLIKQKMMQDLQQGCEPDRDEYINSGELSHLTLGYLQYEDQSDSALRLFGCLSGDQDFNASHQFSESILLDHFELSARITSYATNGLLSYSVSKLTGKHQFKYWLQHCFLCAAEAIEFTRIYDGQSTLSFNVLSSQQALIILKDILQIFYSGYDRVVPFYVQTAFTYETELNKKKSSRDALEKINMRWFGENFQPDREVTDVYTQTSLKQSDGPISELPQEFFDLSSRLMQPMLQNLA